MGINLIQGNAIAGSVETNLGDITVCSYNLSDNNSIRVEVYCVLQRTNSSTKTTFRLYTNITKISSILYTDTIYKTHEEGSTGLDVTLNITDNTVEAVTTSPDGNTYRVACIMKIYSINL